MIWKWGAAVGGTGIGYGGLRVQVLRWRGVEELVPFQAFGEKVCEMTILEF